MKKVIWTDDEHVVTVYCSKVEIDGEVWFRASDRKFFETYNIESFSRISKKKAVAMFLKEYARKLRGL